MTAGDRHATEAWVGAARVDITPVVPVPLAGYPDLRITATGPQDHVGYVGRVGACDGVHDPIYARAVAIDGGNAVVVVVGLDLCVVSLEFTRRVREAAHERWGLPPESIVLAASHSHSGPDYLGYWEAVDANIEERLRELVVCAIGEALARRRPARMGRARSQIIGLSINRRDPAKPVDPNVDIVRFDSVDGTPIAILFAFACHPITAGSQNRLISGEFPGFAATVVEHGLGGSSVAAFLNGAAGDINPLAFPYQANDDVSKKSRAAALAGEPITFRTIAEAARLGTVVGAEVLRVAAQIHTQEELRVWSARLDVELRVKGTAAMGEFLFHMPHEPQLEELYRTASTLQSEVAALRLGDLILIGMPGEPFVEIGLDLQAREANGADVRVLGYVNDYPGYVVPPPEYDANRYENVATPLAREGVEALIDAAETLRARALNA